ncbi:DUF2281 domain-containing protein [Aerosakkonemataceae cyanobacterium BLCC-F50]|uniref:DUF2281 domain-containing protein n=1 Tax=Floridaenema flaviceps BLCC-F50 TaxID=3153642 RepID=A0ABV4XJM4_9CYAN
MTTKDQIIQELNQASESTLVKVLEFIHSLQNGEEREIDEEVWQAYLKSEQEREEVYRRLANS